MANESLDIIEKYQLEGLGRLSKEKLMVIISNLQNMPTHVAMKIAEHIPEYYNVCTDALHGLFSVYKDNKEANDADTQKVFDTFAEQEKLLLKFVKEADTKEERNEYLKKIDDLRKEKEEYQARRERERSGSKKELAVEILGILAFAGGAIGLSTKFGKKIQF